MFCLLLMDVSDPGGSIEDMGCVVKEMVSLLKFSEGLRTIPDTAKWEPQTTFFFTWS